MVLGLPRWDNPDAYYSQVNNPTEEYLRKDAARDAAALRTILAGAGVSEDVIQRAIKAIGSFLESCGNTAATCGVDAVKRIDPLAFTTPGGYLQQPEQVLGECMNDPKNYDAMRQIRSDVDPQTIMGNEVPQWYEFAIPAVFGVPAKFNWSSDLASEIHTAITGGRAVMVCLKDPSHFIVVVAEDPDTGEFIYHDPWPGNYWPAYNVGKPGNGRRVLFADLIGNAQPFRVEIG